MPRPNPSALRPQYGHSEQREESCRKPTLNDGRLVTEWIDADLFQKRRDMHRGVPNRTPQNTPRPLSRRPSKKHQSNDERQDAWQNRPDHKTGAGSRRVGKVTAAHDGLDSADQQRRRQHKTNEARQSASRSCDLPGIIE
jgi:hypothetical protein